MPLRARVRELDSLPSKSWTAAWLVIVVFLSVSFGAWIFRQPFIPGADGYYYALQADEWARTGTVKIPDRSPIHRITGLLQRAGLSTENAIRVWLVFALGLAAFALLPFVRGRLFPLWAALYLLSPAVLFQAITFPKGFLVLIFVPLWLAETSAKRGLALAWITVLLHPSALPLAIGFTLAWLAMLFRERPNRWIVFGAIACIVLAIIEVLPRLTDLSFATWSVVSLMRRPSLPFALGLEIGLAILVFIEVIEHPRSPQYAVLALGILTPSMLALGGTTPFNAGERLALFLPPLVLFAAMALDTPTKEPSRSWAWVGLALAAVIGGIVRPLYAYPGRLDPDYPRFERLVQKLSPLDIPMLIAHRGLNFYYKFRLQREAFPFEPEPHWNKERIWRLTYAITPGELNAFVPKSCQWNRELKQLEDRDYLLVREDCWEGFRARIYKEDDAELYARVWQSPQNPSQLRPAFLLPKHREDTPDEFSPRP